MTQPCCGHPATCCELKQIWYNTDISLRNKAKLTKTARIAYSLDEAQNKLLTLISKHVSGNKLSRNCVTIPIRNSDNYTVFISLLIKQRNTVPCPPGCCSVYKLMLQRVFII